MAPRSSEVRAVVERELHLASAMHRVAALITIVGLAACSRPPRVPVIIDSIVAAEEAPAPADGAPAAPAPFAPLVLPPSPSGAPAAASALASEGFEPLGERRGVKVHRRQPKAGIELAVEGVLAGSPERVLRVLTDYAAHARWQKRLEEQRILASGDSFVDVYERLDLPVLSDRDFVVHVTWGAEGELRWMRFVAATSGGPPPVDGVVRVTTHSGSWRLEPTSGGTKTYAVYRFHLDLAGSFPSWLGSGRATDELPDLFDNIDAELPRYP